jgi:hypothetical protein
MMMMYVVSLAAVFRNYLNWEFVFLKFNACVSSVEACYLFTSV